MFNNKNLQLSVIIPLYNEANGIKDVIGQLKNELNGLGLVYEIIAVNDGSTDNSEQILSGMENIKILNHPYNKGYGAALKSGVAEAAYDWLLFFDADGQHRPEDIEKLLNFADKYDLITGDRSKGPFVRPLMRQPGLWLLGKIANYLVDYKIPDLNCGLRLVRKSVLLKYLHLMPSGFSMSTTSTLAFLKDKRSVKFAPIEVNKRNEDSKSMVKPRDAVNTFMLIFRIIMLFSPLRIFFPASLILFLSGMGFLIYDLSLVNISEGTIFIMLSSILIFFFGLVADQIASLRREVGK